MNTQLVVVSHGMLAEGLTYAAGMIVGPLDDVLVYGLMPGESPDMWRSQVQKDFAEAVNRGADNFLVLADLFGGSPCSSLVPLMHEYNIDIVTGVNLGMLLEVYSNMNEDHADLVQIAQETHAQSCTVLKSSSFGN